VERKAEGEASRAIVPRPAFALDAGQQAYGGTHMAPRIIDISVALQNDIASDPPGSEPKITYVDHKQSASEVCKFFPGLTPADLPDGEGWAAPAGMSQGFASKNCEGQRHANRFGWGDRGWTSLPDGLTLSPSVLRGTRRHSRGLLRAAHPKSAAC
jgi:hypothetical protein